MLTFVWRSAWNGLQFRKRMHGETDGEELSAEEWIDIPHDEDLILVNAGATFEALTNGHVKGVIHRVLGPHSRTAALGQQKSEAGARPLQQIPAQAAHIPTTGAANFSIGADDHHHKF